MQSPPSTRCVPLFLRWVVMAAWLLSCMEAPTQASEIPPPAAAPYTWSNVALGGGGAVPGVVLHPRVPDLAYARTDVGGAFRWDEVASRWIPLLDWIGADAWNHYGVDSLAVDSTDATGGIVYIAVGKYAGQAWAPPARGAVLRSTDRGQTWRSLLDVDVSSNRDQAYGERLAVDPSDGRHVVYASRSEGLWASHDAGSTWARIEIAAWSEAMPPLAFAVFAPPRDGSSRLYIAAIDAGIVHQDVGGRWSLMRETPAKPRRGACGPDGSLVVAGESGLHRFTETAWTEITPPQAKCMQAVAIDPHDARSLLACTSGGHGQNAFLSHDAGATWTVITGDRTGATPGWWPAWHWFSAPASISFDPHHPGRAWASDWYGVYRTEDVRAAPAWKVIASGMEEVVTIGALISPPSGPYLLLSGTADVGGFDHASLTEAPRTTIWAKGLPGGFACTGVDVCESNPLLIARVGTKDWHDPMNGGWSADGGLTYQPFVTAPVDNAGGGRIAITTDGTAMVWAVQGKGVFRTADCGRTWTPCQPAAALHGAAIGKDVFVWSQPLAADRVRPATVYLAANGTLHVSEDGGSVFVSGAMLPKSWMVQVQAAPGIAGEVWVSADDQGLFRSSDAGRTLVRVPGVETAKLFSFGCGAPGRREPAVYVHGRIAGRLGTYRSDDLGTSWIRIDNEQQRLGNDPNQLAGDRRVPGRVFVGTNGRGILVGQPTANRSVPR